MSVSIRHLVVVLLITAANLSGSQAAGSLEIPQEIAGEADLLERFWEVLLAEKNAPADLSHPTINIEPLPRNVKMALLFPTATLPIGQLRIAVSPSALKRARNGAILQVVAELAHEIVHYVLLASENNWKIDKAIFAQAIHNHCDSEFQYLANKIGDIIWQAYHSDNLVRDIQQMNRRSCWEEGHHLGLPGMD